MRIQALQHVPFEGLGSISSWVAEKGHSVHTCELFRNEPPPDPDQFDWLIVLGGPMGVYDEAQHPWLVGEKRLIESAIRAEKTVLGICLGAQLIATVLGKKVTRNPQREIGWFPLKLTQIALQTRIFDSLPAELTVFHWHGDTFEIPDGAIHLASSAACTNQAYLYDKRVLGLQFHLETTPMAAHALVTHCADELTDGEYIQSPTEILTTPEKFEHINATMRVILERLTV